MKNGKDYVLKLGGHVFIDDKGRIRDDILSKYIDIITYLWNHDIRTHLVVGGGLLARFYIEVLKALKASKTYQDIIGIEVSRLNAKILLYALRDRGVNVSFIDNMQLIRKPKNELYVLGGLSPAQSTTAVAALLAEAIKAEKLIIATDVDGVYTDDPKKNPNATLLKRVSIREIIDILHQEHEPGSYKLLDAIALQVIIRSQIITHVINGFDPLNVKRAIEGEEIGTLITP
ncbi:MAG: UMP kinase [Candidatus Nezhaarchaeales archaeon]